METDFVTSPLLMVSRTVLSIIMSSLCNHCRKAAGTRECVFCQSVGYCVRVKLSQLEY